MKNKKSSILVAALSISFVLSSQTALADDLDNSSAYVSGVDESAEQTQSASIFSKEQIKRLTDEGFSEKEIKDLENDAKEKMASDNEFDLDKFIDEEIKAKRENKEVLELGNEVNPESQTSGDRSAQGSVDATSSATYYKKANWDNKIKDKSRWKVEDDQNLVRVTTSDPVMMNDIDYDGMYINANGRYVIRLVYKERAKAASGVWKKALIDFGELDQYIDFSNSYVFGNDGKTRYTFDPVTGKKGRGFDLGSAIGDRTNSRKNLPINLVLKDGVTLESLPKKNYIIQMRLTDDTYERVYTYAPGKSSMDYSSYTKTTSVSLDDNLNNLFIKGGLQNDSNNATNQEFFMSEFIANPKQYKDEKNLGIIRTQYMGQTNTILKETVGGEPMAFTQVFDANLLNYLKEDDAGNVAYLNVLTVGREVSSYSHNFGIKRNQINKIKVDGGQELAYVVIGTSDFQKKGVEVVTIPKHDQHTMLSGIYITAIDYLVDKTQFENTFSSKYTRKLDYSTMSGWTNPNKNGWLVYEKEKFDNDYVVQEGDTFMVDAGAAAKGKQIMVQVGGEQAILRRPQGYYNGYVFSKSALDNFEEIADGIFQFTIGEGTTVKKGKNLKIYMPYTSTLGEGGDKINFLQIHNGTKLNEGAATLTLQKDRKINMHIYTSLPRGASFKLKYTKKGETTQKELVLTKPKGLGTFWQYKDTDGVLKGGTPNLSILASGGNFYIDTKILEEGKDIIVEAYDETGKEIVDRRSWFKYVPVNKSNETVKLLTWTDHSDKRSVLSINKSLYTPYQQIFTNDYAEGNVYKSPKALPSTVEDFNKDTKEIVGYTKYDGGKVRTLFEEGRVGKLIAKVQAKENEYNKDGDLATDASTKIKIARKDVFDPQFAEENKEYKAYEYRVNLAKMMAYQSDDKTDKSLTLLKDMKFVSNASDGSSLPSDLFETRVRARVLFNTTDGKFADDSKQTVRIAPDNVKFYGEEGYVANGFAGEGVQAGTGDEFPEAPSLEGKNFLGWVTKEGKEALNNQAIVSAEDFKNLDKDKIFTATTPVTKHLVVYAVYSQDVTVTFDANGGKIGEDDQVVVKAENGSVTAPKPTKEGYDFQGWASSKNAKSADVTDFSNLSNSKTVYAVWKQKADSKLNLTAPTDPVPVLDKTDLTEGEKDKVKDAVIAANPGLNLTEDEITVGNDGKVTVSTKDGKTGEIPADKTVKQKEVLNNINPPKTPVEVNNKDGLTDDEKDKVKDAIIAANPDLKLTKDDIEVDATGKASIDKGGKVGEVPADKTVVEASKVLKLEKPDPVEVKDINNLTKTEKEKVAAAVKEKNKDKLSTEAVVTVDGNGNVTVTDGNKTGKLDGADTVKPFDRTGKNFNDNIDITEVSDKNNLTEAEKEAVKEAVKDANPELAFKDEEIQVGNDGTVKVPMGTNPDGTTKYETITPDKTVKEDDTTKTISLKAPSKTIVLDPSSLTKGEIEAVKKAVKEANTNLPNDAKVVVANDGSVTVTSGNKTGMLAQADTVVKKLDAPEIAADEDGKVVVGPKDDRTEKIEVSYTPANGGTGTVTAVKDVNGEWKIDPAVEGVSVNKDSGLISIPADKIQNGTEVSAVAKTNDGTNSSDAQNIKSEDKKAPANPEIAEDAAGNVTITLPKDKDAKTAEVTYTPEGATDPVKVTLTKEGDTWKLPTGAPEGITVENGKITIPADKVKNGTDVSAKAVDTNGNESSTPTLRIKTDADKIEPTIPAKTKVGDPTALTEDEQNTVKQAIETANNSKFPARTKVAVGADGKATITYPDGSTDTIPAESLIEEKTQAEKIDPETPAKTGVADVNNLTDEEKADVKKAVEEANKNKFPTPKEGQNPTKVEVGNDGTVTITYPDGSTDTIEGTDLVVKDNTIPQKPTVTPKADGGVEISPAAADGNTKTIEVTYVPEGKTEPVTIKATKGDTGWTLDSNQDGAVTIDNDGKITINADKVADSSDVIAVAKNENGKASAKVSAKTKSTADTTTPVIPTTKTKVGNTAKLSLVEKEAVQKAVEEANKNNFPQGTKVEVGDDGKVTITYPDKSTDTIEASELVVEKPEAEKTQADKTDPLIPAEKTKVDDPSNLKDEEKTSVKEAIEKANKDGSGNSTLPANTNITVGKDGTATITYPDNSIDKIKGSDLVVAKVKKDELQKEADQADNTKASDKYKKADQDKKDAYDAALTAANNVLENQNATQEDVDNALANLKKAKDELNGKSSSPSLPSTGDSSTDNNGGNENVYKPIDKVEVKDKDKLTDAEKKEIADRIKEKNPGIKDVEVDDKGNVTITNPDGTKTKIPAGDVLKEAESKNTIQPIDKVEVKDKDKLTDAEKKEIADRIKEKNPGIKDVEVDDKGNVTVTNPDGTKTKIPAGDVLKEAESKNTIQPIDKVEVKDKDKLTDAEKKEIADRIKEKNPGIKDVEVDDKGNVTITNPDGTKTNIPAGDVLTEAKDRRVVIPAKKIKVKDVNNLTEAEKNAILKAVKKANPDAIKVEMDDKGNVVLTYKDGVSKALPYRRLVEKAEKGAVAMPAKNKDSKLNAASRKRNQAGAKNVKTGVGSVSGLIGLMGTALAGLFVTKKKEDEDK